MKEYIAFGVGMMLALACNKQILRKLCGFLGICLFFNIFIFFYNSREDLQEKVLLLDSRIRCFCIGYTNDIVNTDVIKIRKFY